MDSSGLPRANAVSEWEVGESTNRAKRGEWTRRDLNPEPDVLAHAVRCARLVGLQIHALASLALDSSILAPS